MTTQTKVKHDKAELTEVMRHSGTAHFLKIGGINIAINDDYVDNAREIVKRYNSQPELLEACQYADEAIKNMTAGQSKRIHEKLRQAIQKAEGSL